ncbi:sarcalumenin [Gemella haemolysans]|uniref:sarcalumenin n=1 Tax=Gemella haemolysans TaxID=1379 RepID=UPI0028D90AEC|nr:sarcalumenin [Gemella haemolysans]
MRNNKFIKILIYSVCSLVLAGIIFLAISYFGKEEKVQKNDTSQNSKKQEQVDKPKDKEDAKENKIEESNDQTVKHQEEQKTENKNTVSVENKVTQNGNKNTSTVNGGAVSKVPQQQDYNGKKLSSSEGVGTTGKVFESQKEALDFGKKEVKRLTDEDKKSRQFSISKVTAEDGSLVGWTVDIFEDNNEEKVVSNPKTNEEDKE